MFDVYGIPVQDHKSGKKDKLQLHKINKGIKDESYSHDDATTNTTHVVRNNSILNLLPEDPQNPLRQMLNEESRLSLFERERMDIKSDTTNPTPLN